MRSGKVDKAALSQARDAGRRDQDYSQWCHQAGAEHDFSEVEKCVLGRAGRSTIEAIQPRPVEALMAALQKSIEQLTREVKAMRTLLEAH